MVHHQTAFPIILILRNIKYTEIALINEILRLSNDTLVLKNNSGSEKEKYFKISIEQEFALKVH